MKIIETDLDTFSKTLYKNWCGNKINQKTVTSKELLMEEAEHLLCALQFLFRDEICTSNICTATFLEIHSSHCKERQKEIVGYYTLDAKEIERLRKNYVLSMLAALDDLTNKDITIKREIYVKLLNKLYNTLKRRRK